MITRLTLLALITLTLHLSAQEPAKPTLAEAVKAVIELPRYKTAHWGLYVVDAKTGEVLLDHQCEKFFAPASCTKLFSVAAAFETLGADHRFHSKLLHTGKLEEASKTLHGDLILLASGDLTLGGRTQSDGTIAFKNNDHTYANGGTVGQLTDVDPLQGLHQLAKQLAEKVKQINGEIIVDDRLFDRAEGTGSGPGRITPILVNDNLIDFTITPSDDVSKAATVKYRPEGSAIQVDALVETIAKEGDASKPNKASITITTPSPGRYVVRGKMPIGHAPLLRVREVEDAASNARSLLIDALMKAGIQVKASSLAVNPREKLAASEAVAALPMLTELVSPPLSEHARLILKVSHNLHASTLPMLLAAHHQQRTLAQGLKQQGNALKRLGLPLEGISFGGGAGGDRADHATPKAAVTLLQLMAKRPDGALYRQALPIVGVDGTPAAAVDKSSPARGKFQAKTGTLSWNNALEGNDIMTSKALAGYGETAKGRQVVFAFFVNNRMMGEGGAAQTGRDLGKLCELVYQAE